MGFWVSLKSSRDPLGFERSPGGSVWEVMSFLEGPFGGYFFIIMNLVKFFVRCSDY